MRETLRPGVRSRSESGFDATLPRPMVSKSWSPVACCASLLRGQLYPGVALAGTQELLLPVDVAGGRIRRTKLQVISIFPLPLHPGRR